MKISIKQDKIGNHHVRESYFIYDNDIKIGELSYVKKDNIFCIKFISIYRDYKNRHYGYAVIDYILSHYKIQCIIGQTLLESRGFWNKCIKKYNGSRKNIAIYDNCTSSFIIPKINISNNKIYNLLDKYT